MFSKVMLLIIGAFVIGIIVAGFVFSQTGVSFSNTQPSSGAWHSADQIWCPGCVSSSSLADNSVTASKLATGAVTSADILDNTIGVADVNSNEICTQANGCTSGSNACSLILDTASGQTSSGVALDIPVKCKQGGASSGTAQGVSLGACKLLALLNGGSNSPRLFVVDYHQVIYNSGTPRWTATTSHEFSSSSVATFGDPLTIASPTTRSAMHSLSTTIGQGNIIFLPADGIGISLADSRAGVENVADKWSIWDDDNSFSLQLYVC